MTQRRQIRRHDEEKKTFKSRSPKKRTQKRKQSSKCPKRSWLTSRRNKQFCAILNRQNFENSSIAALKSIFFLFVSPPFHPSSTTFRSAKRETWAERKTNASGKSSGEGHWLKGFSHIISLSSSSIYIERPCFLIKKMLFEAKRTRPVVISPQQLIEAIREGICVVRGLARRPASVRSVRIT